MWEWLGPLITRALDNMTVESVGDWGTCFATASVRKLFSVTSIIDVALVQSFVKCLS